jgi:hypothetical protein
MEQITLGIIREWLYNRRVVVYSVQNFGAAAFVKWSEVIVKTLAELPEDRDYLAVHDLSKTGASMQYLALTGFNINKPWLTPSSEKSFLELQKVRPTMNTRLAIVLSSQFSGQLALRRARATTIESDCLESKTFEDRQLALEWIRSFVAEEDINLP